MRLRPEVACGLDRHPRICSGPPPNCSSPSLSLQPKLREGFTITIVIQAETSFAVYLCMISARQPWNNRVKSRPKLHKNINDVKLAIWQPWSLGMPVCVFLQMPRQMYSFSLRFRKRQIKDGLLGQVLLWQNPPGTGIIQGVGRESQEGTPNSRTGFYCWKSDMTYPETTNLTLTDPHQHP